MNIYNIHYKAVAYDIYPQVVESVSNAIHYLYFQKKKNHSLKNFFLSKSVLRIGLLEPQNTEKHKKWACSAPPCIAKSLAYKYLGESWITRLNFPQHNPCRGIFSCSGLPNFCLTHAQMWNCTKKNKIIMRLPFLCIFTATINYQYNIPYLRMWFKYHIM